MSEHDSTYSRRSVLRLGALTFGAAAGAATLAGAGGNLAVAAPAAAAPAPFVNPAPPVSRRFLQSLDRSVALDGWTAQPFSMSQVTLEPSVFTRAQDQALNLARAYPVDRILAVFRRTAGLDTKGANAPGGWEGFGHANEDAWGPDDYPGRANTQTANLLRGHYAGHFLSMVALAYGSTGEAVFKDKVDAIVTGLGEVQAALAATGRYSHPGFLAAYGEWQFSQLEKYAPYGEIWAPYYTCHKIMAGLLEAYHLTGSAQALQIVTSMGEWVHSRLSKLPADQLERMWAIYIAGEYGGMNEVMADLHQITGREDFLATAKLFDLNALVNASAAGTDTLNGKHANQHIPQFPGYLKVYSHTHEQKYFDAVKNFWGMVVPGRTYAHGGNGEGELWGPANTVAGDIGTRNAETCATYNMLKVSRLLYFHTLDPKYMDYYETGVLNHILGSRKNAESSTSPEVTYMYPVHPGARREYDNTGTCCGGTGLENHVKYRDSIYFRSAEDAPGNPVLHVNLYVASTLDWSQKGFEIVQQTEYPEVGASTLVVNGSGPLDLRLRVPRWIQRGFTVKVNGVAQDLEATPGTYVTVSRTWTSGDRVEISMPLSLRVEPTIDNPSIQALHYGPVVLLARSSATKFLKLSLYASMRLDGSLDTAAKALGDNVFQLGDLTFEPAYSGGSALYHMYFERSEPRIVFAGTDSGVANARRANGTSFLDVVWAEGSFADRAAFLATVQRTAETFVAEGLLTRRDSQKVLVAAGKAKIA